MSSNHSHWRYLSSAALVVGLTVSGLPENVFAGPPIEFSKPGEKASQLVPKPKDDRPSEPFEVLDRESSLGGVVPPPAVAPQPSERTLELLDRRKNWIFNKGLENFSNRRGWRENSEAGGFGALDGRPKSVLQEFYDERGSKATNSAGRRAPSGYTDASESDHGRLDRGDIAGRPLTPRPANPYETYLPANAGLFAPVVTPLGDHPQDRVRSGLNWTPDRQDGLSGNRPRQNSMELFQPLAASPGFNRIVPAGLDPLNPGTGSPGLGFSPISGSRLGELSGTTGGSLFSTPLPAAGPASGGAPGILDQELSVSPGRPGFSPAAIPAAEPVRVQSRPSVLEFPSRNF